MNPALAGLFSSLSYGVGDFFSGLASRRDEPLRVVALNHPVGGTVLLLLAWALHQPVPPHSDLWWGAASGVVGMVALVAFFRALALGPMGAVSVMVGALAAAVPVLFGVLGGESLSVVGWLGAAAVLVGTGLLSITPGGSEGKTGIGRGMLLGIFAGIGFGFFFALLGQAKAHDGALWTLAAARVASTAFALPAAALTVGLRPRGPGLILASIPGDILGNLFYLFAVQGGGLAIGALLSSLYPAVTTLLAVVFLRERMRPLQWSGVAVALVGAVLLALR